MIEDKGSDFWMTDSDDEAYFIKLVKRLTEDNKGYARNILINNNVIKFANKWLEDYKENQDGS